MQALIVLLPVAWLVTTVLYAMSFGGPRAPHVDRPRHAALSLTLGLHALYFVLRGIECGGFPRVGTTWEAISAVALCTALLFVLVERGHPESGAEASTGGVVLGTVFVLQLLASGSVPLDVEPARAGLVHALHVVTSALACSAVVLSGLHGGLYLLLFRQMRRRSFGVLFRRLPDLQHLSRLTRLSALSGFVLLGIGLNVGIGWAHFEGVAGFSYTDPFVLVVMLLWVHFGLVAFSGRIPGLSARRAAFAAAGGFLVLVLAFVLTLTPASFHGSP